MPSIETPAFAQDLTVNGDSTGYLTVVDNAGFFAGAEAYLVSDTAETRAIITEIVGSVQVGIRFLANSDDKEHPRYGMRSDASAYTTADHARLSMPKQVVRVDQPTWTKKAGTV